MYRLRQQVTDNNIYRWAGMLISQAGKLFQTRHGGNPPVASSPLGDQVREFVEAEQ
jgi:hypothetical protein